MAGGVERVEKALEACTAAGDSPAAAEPIREYLRLVNYCLFSPVWFSRVALSLQQSWYNVSNLAYLQVREFKLRQSGPVATFGSRLLQKHRSSLPQDERGSQFLPPEYDFEIL